MEDNIMKKTYITPKSNLIRIEVEALIAGSDSLGVDNNPHNGVQGDSNRRTSSIWDNMD